MAKFSEEDGMKVLKSVVEGLKGRGGYATVVVTKDTEVKVSGTSGVATSMIIAAVMMDISASMLEQAEELKDIGFSKEDWLDMVAIVSKAYAKANSENAIFTRGENEEWRS